MKGDHRQARVVDLCGWRVRLATELSAPMRTLPQGTAFDWTFSVQEGPIEAASDAEELWAAPWLLETGRPVQWIGRTRDHGEPVIRFSEVCEFHLGRDGVSSAVLDTRYAHMVELRFLGYVLSALHEFDGTPVLHGSCVATSGGAGIVFCGPWGAGKTSLAVDSLARGADLVSDDIVPIRSDTNGSCVAIASFPQLRIWPDDARLLGLDPGDLARVSPTEQKRRVPIGNGFGNYRFESVEVKLIVLLERENTAAANSWDIEELSPGAAVVALCQEAFLEHIVDPMGWRQRHMQNFAKVVEQASVLRVRHNAPRESMQRLLHDIATLDTVNRALGGSFDVGTTIV